MSLVNSRMMVKSTPLHIDVIKEEISTRESKAKLHDRKLSKGFNFLAKFKYSDLHKNLHFFQMSFKKKK